MSSRLTINAGLRWEVRRPPYDTSGQTSAFNGTRGKIVVASLGGEITGRTYPQLFDAYKDLIVTATEAGWDEKRLVRTNWKNYAPRFGFALSLDQRGNYILRGGNGR